LAIADPPYGIDINSSGRLVKEKGREYKEWDTSAPDKEWFDELQRVCDHFILWGANHYIDRIPVCSKAWVVWDKNQPEALSFAMCELALSNFEDKTAKIFRYSPMRQNAEEIRIHPTQKPVALYAWIYKNYANGGGKIFDPMMGSQSSRIAAYYAGLDYCGCEIDKEYFVKGCERFNRECHGIIKQKDGTTIQQLTLF
jgi:site-specific DNA-methyltransferase (adenine-specific)